AYRYIDAIYSAVAYIAGDLAQEEVVRARTGRARAAARDPDARLRAAETAARNARVVPHPVVGHGLPDLAATAEPGLDRGIPAARAHVEPANQARVPDHNRWQEAVHRTRDRLPAAVLRRQDVRGARGLLLPHPGGNPAADPGEPPTPRGGASRADPRSEEHTSELQSRE